MPRPAWTIPGEGGLTVLYIVPNKPPSVFIHDCASAEADEDVLVAGMVAPV